MGQCWAITFSSKSCGFGQNIVIMMLFFLNNRNNDVWIRRPFPGWKLGFSLQKFHLDDG